MVGNAPESMEWAEHDTSTPYPDDRIGHLHNWVGSLLSGEENGRTVVSNGERDAHQVPRTARSHPSGENMLCQRAEQSGHPTENGQHNGHLVHKQTGGTVSPQLNQLTRDLWLWCMNRNITLKVVHLAGKLNVVVDEESRSMKDRTDWQLMSRGD